MNTQMNLLDLAKKTIAEKAQWSVGENVTIFQNASRNVYLRLTQHGKLIMFVSGINIDLDMGYRDCPTTINETAYQAWADKVKKAMAK